MPKKVELSMPRLFLTFLIIIAACTGIYSQTVVQLADDETIPGIVRSLPDWESVFDKAVHTKKRETLKEALGSREVIDMIDFTGGTEAVTAPYDEGKLLIIEYPTPQASVGADEEFLAKLQTDPSAATTVYRRIGNYNAFVFDVTDQVAATALLDRVRYEKTVQWLGKDPNFAQKVERYLAVQTADIFLSTVIAIVGGLGFAVVAGVISGLVFYRFRDQQRQSMTAYSDAGGMIRLNLDDLTGAVDESA